MKANSICIESSDGKKFFMDAAGAYDELEGWLSSYKKKYGVDCLLKLIGNFNK
jgi:hypothetical protein